MTPTADIRWQQRLSNFERALALLREAMLNGPAALNQLEKEGVIQRFEYCFELAWKTTKDYMEAKGFLFAVVMPRQAGAQGCLCRQADRRWPGVDRHARPPHSAVTHLQPSGV